MTLIVEHFASIRTPSLGRNTGEIKVVVFGSGTVRGGITVREGTFVQVDERLRRLLWTAYLGLEVHRIPHI